MTIVYEMMFNLLELSITKLDADKVIGIFNALNSIYHTGHAVNFGAM